MTVLHSLQRFKDLDATAIVGTDTTLTYRQLWDLSDRLAAYITHTSPLATTPDATDVIPVYGHKSAYMLVAFLGALKAGYGYCPMDTSFPPQRTASIIDTVNSPLVLTTIDQTPTCAGCVLVQDILAQPPSEITPPSPTCWVDGENTQYVLFTSGSSGAPKGVKIPASAVDNFGTWISGVGGDKHGKTYLNQAPFSFDLSVMELTLSLINGGTLYCLDKATQGDYAALFDGLTKANINIWVSTPSFADLCLANRDFKAENFPTIELFLFCGETLTPKTASSLLERFPSARIFNTYGPTESTVCVTEVEITANTINEHPVLPIGYARPGTRIEIRDGNTVVPEGEPGEMCIIGDTVSTGYYKNPQLSAEKFFTTPDGQRGYRTGDKGYINNGLVFYTGRIDLQIKLHGYRIELEDVESNLMRVPGMQRVCVLPVYDRNNKVKSMNAYCVYNTPETGNPETDTKPDQAIRDHLAQFVPAYMIPKKITCVDVIPMTPNGKTDRKATEALYAAKKRK